MINLMWLDDKPKAPHVNEILNFTDSFVQWTITQILLPKSDKGCAKVIEKFIQIMIKCREYNNYIALFDIQHAFQNNAIHRLKLVWKHINRRGNHLWTKYEELCNLLSNESNYKNYRDTLYKASQPCLPCLNIVLADISKIEKEEATYLTDEMEELLINFIKMRQLGDILQNIITFQQTPYHFHKVEWIYNYFARPLNYYSPEECFNQSLSIAAKS